MNQERSKSIDPREIKRPFSEKIGFHLENGTLTGPIVLISGEFCVVPSRAKKFDTLLRIFRRSNTPLLRESLIEPGIRPKVDTEKEIVTISITFRKTAKAIFLGNNFQFSLAYDMEMSQATNFILRAFTVESTQPITIETFDGFLNIENLLRDDSA